MASTKFLLPVLCGLLYLAGLGWLCCQPSMFKRRRHTHAPRRHGWHLAPAPCSARTRAKPAWVREELIALAARSTLSCRNLALVLNRRHAAHGIRVGKTFVAEVLKRHRADIACCRRRLQQRRYHPGRRNLVWGLDGTGKTNDAGELHFLLGLIDHGTRLCLALDVLPDKRATTIVQVLHKVIASHGKPKAIRTDNEAVFRSHKFNAALKQLGIKHQTTELHCPWQNGRIERFFGTLKDKLDRWAVADADALQASLAIFRSWYNHVRPHQHLGGLTPLEAWAGIDIRRPARRRLWFEGWDGLLQGEYLQR